MPTYEYICENCGYQFEQFQSITAKPLNKCTNCGRASLKRLIGSGSGIIFKGSGFYQTDYRSESYTKAETNEKSNTDINTTKKKTKPQAKDSKSSKNTKPNTENKDKSA